MKNTYTYTELKNLTIEFSKLKDNWDGYKAIPPEPCILVYFSFLIEKLESINFNVGKIVSYYPCTHGTIMLDFKCENREGYLEIGEDSWTMCYNKKQWLKIKHNDIWCNFSQLANTIRKYVK